MKVKINFIVKGDVSPFGNGDYHELEEKIIGMEGFIVDRLSRNPEDFEYDIYIIDFPELNVQGIFYSEELEFIND